MAAVYKIANCRHFVRRALLFNFQQFDIKNKC